MTKLQTVKAFFFLCIYICVSSPLFPQGAAMPADSNKLIPQKENIIRDETIIKIENIGESINTGLAELRPTISADGDLLFFIRQHHPFNTNYYSVPNSQDIWFSERDTTTGKWSPAVHLGKPLNTADYNAVFWISPDNNTC